MTITISAADELQFRFRKTGGAKMTMRIAVWRNPGTPQQQRVRLLFVGNGAGSVETPPAQAPLEAGPHQIVAVIMVEEAVSGTFDYEAALNGQVFAAQAGDVNTTAGVDVAPFIHRENLTVV